MKARRLLDISIFFSIALILLGCSNIHNIRDVDYPPEVKVDKFLTFMTFNIRVGAGTESWGTGPHLLKGSKENLEKVTAAIESVDPDVIGLQEVGGSYQARFLAKKLNLNYVYASHLNPWFTEWGLAILSKFKILKTRQRVIYSDLDIRRGVACTVDIHGKPITVFNVHYHLGSYEEQVKTTMSFLKKTTGAIVLLGDFNRREWDYELGPIQEKMIDTCTAVVKNETARGGFGTYGSGVGRRIDYIFVDPKSFEPKDVGLASPTHWGASDYIGYFAHIVFKAR